MSYFNYMNVHADVFKHIHLQYLRHYNLYAVILRKLKTHHTNGGRSLCCLLQHTLPEHGHNVTDITHVSQIAILSLLYKLTVPLSNCTWWQSKSNSEAKGAAFNYQIFVSNCTSKAKQTQK